MSDYIKRDDLASAMEELLRSPYANNNSENIMLRQFSFGVRDALKLVRDMAKDDVSDSLKIPSADVRENVRGKWIDDRGNIVPFEENEEDPYCPRWSCYCSVCGEWLTASNEYAVTGKYCPNCGADMRGESDVANR